MPQTFSQLCARLCSQNDSLATQEAKRWLEEHPEAAEAPELIRKIEIYSPDEDAIDWCVEFLRKHPQHRESSALAWSHSLISLTYKTTLANLNENSAEDISELHDLVRNEQVIELSKLWLSKYPSPEHTLMIFLTLCHVSPSKADYMEARKLLKESKAQDTTCCLLAWLLEHDCQPEFVLQALQILRESEATASKDIEINGNERILAVALWNFVNDEQTKDMALSWWKRAFKGQQARSAVMAIFSALPNETIASLTVDYLFANPPDSFFVIIWHWLLIRNCTDSILSKCWDWLCENPEFEYWDNIYSYFLIKGCQTPCKLPTQAIDKTWEKFKNGKFNYGQYLLQTDRNEQTTAVMLALVKRAVSSNLHLDDLIATLLKVAPSSSVIELAREWILSKQEQPQMASNSILALIEIAPTDSLTEIANKLLEQQDGKPYYLLLLAQLIRKTDNLWALALAHRLLAHENNLGFRNFYAKYTGELLIALVETGKADLSTEQCAKNWLKFYAHEHAELADRLRQATH